LEVFVRGLNGQEPWGGVGPLSPSTATTIQRRKVALDKEGRIQHIPGALEVQEVTYQGCPVYMISTCALPHNMGGPSSPDQSQGLYNMQPAGTWYEISFELWRLIDGEFVFDRTCVESVQLKWLETANILGCVPSGRIQDIQEPEPALP